MDTLKAIEPGLIKLNQMSDGVTAESVKVTVVPSAPVIPGQCQHGKATQLCGYCHNIEGDEGEDALLQTLAEEMLQLDGTCAQCAREFARAIFDDEEVMNALKRYPEDADLDDEDPIFAHVSNSTLSVLHHAANEESPTHDNVLSMVTYGILARRAERALYDRDTLELVAFLNFFEERDRPATEHFGLKELN